MEVAKWWKSAVEKVGGLTTRKSRSPSCSSSLRPMALGVGGPVPSPWFEASRFEKERDRSNSALGLGAWGHRSVRGSQSRWEATEA